MAGKTTAEQQAEFMETFKMFDKNNDDKISMTELRGMMERMGQSPSQEELDGIMRTADTDKDGFIDFQEFMVIMTAYASDPADRLLEAFQLMDTDNSGSISASELKTVLRNVSSDKVSDEEVEDIIREIDLNGDGQVDYDEFVKVFNSKK